LELEKLLAKELPTVPNEIPSYKEHIKREETLKYRITQLEEYIRLELTKVAELKNEISGKSDYFSKQIHRLQLLVDQKSDR
jgi:hypothetical protein